MPFEAAAAELRSVAGSQLDPRVVEALLVVVEVERESRPAAVAVKA
jgi:HD-GYP domain-containing protein (c-di-GMP phosphodiesterase class II)